MNTPIEYIGRKPTWKDVLYGTGLTFVSGQVRTVPDTIASRFLRHIDLFRVQEPEQAQKELEQTAASTTATNAQQGHLTDSKDTSTQVDDTAALLEAAKKVEEEQAQKELEHAGLMDQIRVMSKDELLTLAKDRWNQVIHKNTTLENARERVIQFANQYGAA